MKSADEHQDCKTTENTPFGGADFDSKKTHTWELRKYRLIGHGQGALAVPTGTLHKHQGGLPLKSWLKKGEMY